MEKIQSCEKIISPQNINILNEPDTTNKFQNVPIPELKKKQSIMQQESRDLIFEPIDYVKNGPKNIKPFNIQNVIFDVHLVDIKKLCFLIRFQEIVFQ